MIRMWLLFLMALTLASCATQPPVQAMAEARAAVQSVRLFYADNNNQGKTANHLYKSAEKALLEATEALDKKHYELAAQKAHEAKRKARLAAKLKQN